MTPGNAVWLGVGFLAGMATWFTQIDAPKSADCSIPKVSRKVATSYVLRPPPAAVAPAVIYKACPQVEKVEPAKVEEPVVEEKPRRHRRHHRRWRRYWR